MNQYIFQNCQIVSKRILSLVYSQSILFSMYEEKLYIIHVLLGKITYIIRSKFLPTYSDFFSYYFCKNCVEFNLVIINFFFTFRYECSNGGGTPRLKFNNTGHILGVIGGSYSSVSIQVRKKFAYIYL